MLSVKASSHVKLVSDCIICVYFFLLSPLLIIFLLYFICNYWVPLATRHAFLMVSTSPMYFYISFVYSIICIVYCEMEINKLELQLLELPGVRYLATHAFSPGPSQGRVRWSFLLL